METFRRGALGDSQGETGREMGPYRAGQFDPADPAFQTGRGGLGGRDNDRIQSNYGGADYRRGSSVAPLVYAGLAGAGYAVATLALAPLGFGPIQLRVAGLLKPLALWHPAMALGLAVGVALANLASPFGFWDFGIMPIVTYAAAMVCYRLRAHPVLALLIQAGMIAAGVAIFPLGIGGGIPVWPTVAMVFVSETILYLIGYFAIWKRSPLDI